MAYLYVFIVMAVFVLGVRIGVQDVYLDIGLTQEDVVEAKKECKSGVCIAYVIYLPIATKGDVDAY
jgi:hypothetical protein